MNILISLLTILSLQLSYQELMFAAKNSLISLVILASLLASLRASTDIWNRLVRIESQIQQADYSYQVVGTNSSAILYKSFALQLYWNHTFRLSLDTGQTNQGIVLMGSTEQKSNSGINNHQYILSSDQLEGTASYQPNKGLKWTIDLEIKDLGISLGRQEYKSSYINEILLIIFGILSVIILPLSDRMRNKMLFNIRKRTYPAMSYIILLKLALVVFCFLTNCYYYVANSPWYHLFWVYGLYLFMIAPSIAHSMYFISSLQRQIKEIEWFKLQKTSIKCLYMSFTFLSIPLWTFFLVFVSKAIFFYFLSSLVTLYQYIQACRAKKYGFGKVILYDLLLTAILSLLSAFVPSLNFSLLTFKQQVLFWNYYIGMFIFGIFLTRIIIKLQIAEEVYLQENNQSLPGPGQSQRRQEIPKINTNQILES